MSPDEINKQHGKAVYRCRNCRTEEGLHWYRDTSCPVCSNDACIKLCDDEWREMLTAPKEEEDL